MVFQKSSDAALHAECSAWRAHGTDLPGFRAFAILLLLASFCFAQTTICTATESCNQAIGESGLVAIALMATLVVIALAYMIGRAGQNEKYVVWAKDEAAQLGISIMLAMFIGGFFTVGCLVACEYSGTEGGSPFQKAYKYIDALSERQGLRMARSLMQQSMNEQLEATTYKFWGVPLFGGCGIAQKAARKALAQHKEMAIDMMMPAMISLKVQKNALQMVEQFGYAVLLPLALILRILPPSREAGNFLIALAFGIYVIFPMTYVLNATAAQAISAELVSGSPLVTSISASLHNDTNVDYITMGFMLPQAILLPNISLVILITSVMALTKALRTFQAMV